MGLVYYWFGWFKDSEIEPSNIKKKATTINENAQELENKKTPKKAECWILSISLHIYTQNYLVCDTISNDYNSNERGVRLLLYSNIWKPSNIEHIY